MQKKYRIRYTYSSRDDIRGMKKYILESFKYRELGENFTKKINKPYRTYLLFYIVDEGRLVVTILRVLQDGMNWQYILKRWVREQDIYIN